jgi:hypothetical protein
MRESSRHASSRTRCRFALRLATRSYAKARQAPQGEHVVFLLEAHGSGSAAAILPKAPTKAKDQPHKDELAAYLALPQIENTSKWAAIEWWKENESQFPNLALMARQHLGCPATSATVRWSGSSRRSASCSPRSAPEHERQQACRSRVRKAQCGVSPRAVTLGSAQCREQQATAVGSDAPCAPAPCMLA